MSSSIWQRSRHLPRARPTGNDGNDGNDGNGSITAHAASDIPDALLTTSPTFG
ncbi:hypothetical protein ACWCQB_34505 [Streptomyces hirsutus]